MRGVQTAENTVPVGVIALRTQQAVAAFEQFLGGLRPGSASGSGGYARGSTQHFFIEEIGFGIFSEKGAPGAAAKKGNQFWAQSKFLQQRLVAEAGGGGQNPLHHFGVGGGGQIGAADGLVG